MLYTGYAYKEIVTTETDTSLFHDGGRYHIETSPLILFRKSVDWFLYDNGLRHERVNGYLGSFNIPLKLQMVDTKYGILQTLSTKSVQNYLEYPKFVNKLLPLKFY